MQNTVYECSEQETVSPLFLLASLTLANVFPFIKSLNLRRFLRVKEWAAGRQLRESAAEGTFEWPNYVESGLVQGLG